jgi:large repetitive protein
VSGTAELTVAGPPPASIVVTPATSTIGTGATQTYTAEGYDDLGNDLGDVTAQTVFTIDGGGSCTGNTCGATQPGTYMVTGTDGTASATAQLTVVATVAITSFSPASGTVGTTVTISGSGFSGASGVTFAGTSASFTIVSPTQITATVPSGATSGPISVTTPNGSATSANSFAVVPKISGFTPTGGTVGTVVTINGSAFTGTTDVRFNGAPSAFTVVSYGVITATVPADAVTGKITVITPSDSASTGTNFQVKPTISGFTPTSGPIGTVVTINGTGFAGAIAVKFQATAASFTIVSGTQLRATVPAGARTGVISVSTQGGTAKTGTKFRVTR